MAWNVSSIGKLVANFFSNPAAGADSKMFDLTHTVVGGGRSLGGATSNTQTIYSATNANRRGIKQLLAGVLNSHAVGDAMALYLYNLGHWGLSAGSDEGSGGLTTQMVESSQWFHGTVSSTTGTGDTAPVLAFTSGDQYTVDGGYLLNITKGTLSGTLTGVSTGLSLTINSGSVATFLNKLPTTGSALPVSTAIGIAIGAIAPALTTRDVPVAVTIMVNLAQIGGVYHLFTNGSVVSVAGNQQPEQSIVSGASGLLAGNQQTFTLHVANANAQAVIFQGGIQGNYISADVNDMRSAYFAFGSLTGTDMIYGNQVAGGVTGNILPNAGCEKWQATGVNSAWHLYPGAEIIKNTDSGFACTLEQNGVVWTNGDVVQGAPFPTAGGAGAFIVREQWMPSNGSFGMSGISVQMGGPGTSGANTAGIRLVNQLGAVNYTGAAGPLTAPMGLLMAGQYTNPIYIFNGPDTSSAAVIKVQNFTGSGVCPVIELNNIGAQLNRDTVHSRWNVDKMDATGFSAGGAAGQSFTVPIAPVSPLTVPGSITFVGGIPVSYTPPS